MFSIIFRIDGLEHKLDTLALLAGELDEPLGKFGNVIKKAALERYKAQDFAPLAEATTARRAQKGLATLEGKLRRDVRRAIKRTGGGPRPHGALTNFLMGGGASLLPEAMGQQSKSTRNRLAVLAAFQQRRGRQVSGLASTADLKPLSVKQMASLGAREDRAMANAVGAPVLGGLPRTLVVEVDRDTVTIASRTHQKWSAAHNEGATVGHGAKLPKRETLPPPSSKDMDLLIDILRSHLLLAFEEG